MKTTQLVLGDFVNVFSTNKQLPVDFASPPLFRDQEPSVPAPSCTTVGSFNSAAGIEAAELENFQTIGLQRPKLRRYVVGVFLGGENKKEVPFGFFLRFLGFFRVFLGG